MKRWFRWEAGWYMHEATGFAVCREADGLWHAYVERQAPPGDSRHRTMRLAMRAVERAVRR